SLLARSKVGPNGKIFSFEPSKENISLFKKSIVENSFTNIIVVDAAVSDHDGHSELFLSPFYKSEHSLFEYNYSSGEHKGSKQKIKIISIDSFLEKTEDLKVDIIKMDVEGSEKKSLDGMKKTIQFNKKLTLITEFWPQGFVNAGIEPKEFLEILTSSGFSLYHIDEFLQKTYSVTVNEMLKITKDRIKKPVERTKENQAGRWYTNLLCIK
ncbi:FkbM family methyltransferase, partial [Candidatus Nitrosarchaeum limnium]